MVIGESSVVFMGNTDEARCVFPLTNLQIGYGFCFFGLISFAETEFIWFVCFALNEFAFVMFDFLILSLISSIVLISRQVSVSIRLKWLVNSIFVQCNCFPPFWFTRSSIQRPAGLSL